MAEYSRGTYARVMAMVPSERTQGMPGAQSHPWPRVRKKSTRVSPPQVRRIIPAFPARWCYGFLRALPGDRAFLSPSQATMREHRRQLDASVEASEPHDFAVRLAHRSSVDAKASIASRTQRS